MVHKSIGKINNFIAIQSIKQPITLYGGFETTNLKQKPNDVKVQQAYRRDVQGKLNNEFGNQYSVNEATSNVSDGFFGNITNLFQDCCNNAMVERDGKAHFNASVMSRENRS